jgi:hypothetical protein
MADKTQFLIVIELPPWPAGFGGELLDDAARDDAKAIVDLALQTFIERLVVYSGAPGFISAALGSHFGQFEGARFVGSPTDLAMRELSALAAAVAPAFIDTAEGRRPAIYRPLLARFEGAPPGAPLQ